MQTPFIHCRAQLRSSNSLCMRKETVVQRLLPVLFFLAALMLALSGCGGSTDATPPVEPATLLQQAADKIRAADTFKLYVLQQGAPYNFAINLSQDPTELMNVQFRLAEGQFVSPDELYAKASVKTNILTLDVEIYAKDADQWFRATSLSVPWLNAPFAPGFNPVALVGDEGGFEAALTSLVELNFLGAASLEDGQPVWHLSGIADGQKVAALVVGLLQIEGSVPVDVYIHRETGYPVRVLVTQPNTTSEQNPDPTQWVIDVYDINAPAEFTRPTEG